MTVQFQSVHHVPRNHSSQSFSWTEGSLRWRHNGRDGVLNHQPHDCLLNRLFGYRSKKTSKLRVTGLCARNAPGTGEFPAQKASNAEYVSMWWRHNVAVMGPWFRFLESISPVITLVNNYRQWECRLSETIPYWEPYRLNNMTRLHALAVSGTLWTNIDEFRQTNARIKSRAFVAKSTP